VFHWQLQNKASFLTVIFAHSPQLHGFTQRQSDACSNLNPISQGRPSLPTSTTRTSPSLLNTFPSSLNHASDLKKGISHLTLIALRFQRFDIFKRLRTARLQTAIFAALMLRTLMKDARRGLQSGNGINSIFLK
jgi:hypothetical protein